MNFVAELSWSGVGGMVSQWYARTGGSVVTLYLSERAWERERREVRREIRARKRVCSNHLHVVQVDVAIKGI